MRVVSGSVNAVLMVTLVKPIVRRMVARWRRQAQESPAAAMGIPVQELLETALIEELGATAVELEAELDEAEEQQAGRSIVRSLLIAGVVATAITGAAFGIAKLVQRRREARAAKERELVAIPIETASEAIEEAAEEALAR